MDKWLKVSIVAVTVLLAGAGAYHFVFAPARLDQARHEQGRSAVEECRQAAWMVYDVHWAAACVAQVGQAAPGSADGHAECDLPDAKAAVVNAWLKEAEEQCKAGVRAGLAP